MSHLWAQLTWMIFLEWSRPTKSPHKALCSCSKVCLTFSSTFFFFQILILVPFRFSGQDNSRTWYLSASNQEEMKSWMDVVKQSIVSNSPQKYTVRNQQFSFFVKHDPLFLITNFPQPSPIPVNLRGIRLSGVLCAKGCADLGKCSPAAFGDSLPRCFCGQKEAR